jgi:hypothetical protein
MLATKNRLARRAFAQLVPEQDLRRDSARRSV